MRNNHAPSTATTKPPIPNRIPTVRGASPSKSDHFSCASVGWKHKVAEALEHEPDAEAEHRESQQSDHRAYRARQDELARRCGRAQQAELAALPPVGQQQTRDQPAHGDGDARPGEVAGEGDDADVDGGQLTAADDRPLVTQPVGVVVEGDGRARRDRRCPLGRVRGGRQWRLSSAGALAVRAAGRPAWILRRRR